MGILALMVPHNEENLTAASQLLYEATREDRAALIHSIVFRLCAVELALKGASPLFVFNRMHVIDGKEAASRPISAHRYVVHIQNTSEEMIAQAVSDGQDEKARNLRSVANSMAPLYTCFLIFLLTSIQL